MIGRARLVRAAEPTTGATTDPTTDPITLPRLGAARCLVLMLTAATALAAGTGTAAADAPVAVGWWNLAHQAVAPPAPPDVAAGDLLVQGGPEPSAVSALRFSVPAAALVGSLTLPLAPGAAPGRAELTVACPVTKAWTPVGNGTWADVPTWSCQRSAPAVLSADGKALVVGDIGRLVAEDGTLSFVLVPGSTDRVVLAPPPISALAVTLASAAVGLSAAPPPLAPAVAPGGGSSAGSGSGVGVAPVSFNPGAGAVPPAPAPEPQVVALPPPALGPGPAAALPAASTRSTKADDGRTRLLLGLEALLVLAFFGLLGVGPLGVLARLTGQPVPDPDRPRGIGRFTATRTGAAPRL